MEPDKGTFTKPCLQIVLKMPFFCDFNMSRLHPPTETLFQFEGCKEPQSQQPRISPSYLPSLTIFSLPERLGFKLFLRGTQCDLRIFHVLGRRGMALGRPWRSGPKLMGKLVLTPAPRWSWGAGPRAHFWRFEGETQTRRRWRVGPSHQAPL